MMHAVTYVRIYLVFTGQPLEKVGPVERTLELDCATLKVNAIRVDYARLIDLHENLQPRPVHMQGCSFCIQLLSYCYDVATYKG